MVVVIMAPTLAYLGLSWPDMTTWAALGSIFVKAGFNPVVIVSVLVSLWNLITDATSKGLSDSTQALTYKKPKNV